MNALEGLVRTSRPSQWAKNLFVFAPVVFARELRDPERTLRVLAAFAIFSLAASSIYLVNDTLDREADRAHPTKRNRPLAAGSVSPALALGTAVVLMLASLAWATVGLGDVRITAVIGVYLTIQLLYSWRLKHVVVLDVLCIASGFVLRLLVGGFAGRVPQSTWILICTIFLSLFLALCKRRSEVMSLGTGAADHRAILSDYPAALLDQMISAATSASLVTYVLYTVDVRTVAMHGALGEGAVPVMLATVPCVVYGVFRYLYLVYRRGGGGSPTSTLVRDVPSLVNVLVYGLTVLAVFSFRSTG